MLEDVQRRPSMQPIPDSLTVLNGIVVLALLGGGSEGGLASLVLFYGLVLGRDASGTFIYLNTCLHLGQFWRMPAILTA